jgi:hypothetical protein
VGDLLHSIGADRRFWRDSILFSARLAKGSGVFACGGLVLIPLHGGLMHPTTARRYISGYVEGLRDQITVLREDEVSPIEDLCAQWSPDRRVQVLNPHPGAIGLAG